MAGKLKIYACSGIGDAPKGRMQMYDYWTDNTNTLNNTQAVNGLLADINLLMAEIDYISYLSDRDVIDRLNQIDLLVVCLDAAQNYAQHYTKLEKARDVIGTMLAQGQFKSNSLDNQSRDEHLDNLLTYFNDAMAADGQYNLSSSKFANWFDQNVISKNQVGLPVEERTAMQSALSEAVSGIGDADWHSDKDLSKYLSDAGTYFLYTYFTSAQLAKIPAKNRTKIKTKIEKQKYTYNFCRDKFVGIYGSEAKYKEIIRTGIIAQFGVTPEDVCEDIATGKRTVQGIGQIATEIIVAIIGAIVPILIATITAICECIGKSNQAKYAALDQKIVTGGVPNEDDFAGMDMGGGSGKSGLITAGGSGMLPLLIIGGAALLALMKK